MKSRNNILIKSALCWALFLMWLPGKLLAQLSPQLNPKLEALALPQSSPGWIDFRKDVAVNPSNIFVELKDAFNLSANDDMKIKKVNKDDLGFSHFRYDQFYKGVKVMYGEYIVHQQPDGFVKSANGRLIEGLNLGNTPGVSEKQALTAALQFMNARKYLWQDEAVEKDLKAERKDPAATYFPKGELVYAPGNNEGTYKPSQYRLAWHFQIYTDDDKVPARHVYVDAITGQVNHYTQISMNCSSGTGTSAFNGSVGINTQLSSGSYRSYNDCQATKIYVYNCNGGAKQNVFYTDGDNSWTDASAVQAQFGAKKTYEYYFNIHSRSSWDGASGSMIAYNNAKAGENNACWGCTGNSAIFYAGNTSSATDDWNTDDIMGHEFTHGVTQASANLVYEKESGALNESFSDIFGEMVESYTEGNCDYLVGADRGAIRSFIDPKSYNDPDTYLGSKWVATTCSPAKTNDYCGVHTNSGVQNHWFYLLSEGGSGTNDKGTSYDVAGITRFKARLIAYRALTQYLTSSSQYIDARAASLHAAWDLYGQCSPEIIAVGDAWHAVGVESQSAQFAKNACGTFTNGEFVQAISQLTAASGCTVTINSPSETVYFTARDRVILYPGFKAVSGSKFVAYLESCSSTMWKSDGSDVNKSDIEKGIAAPIVQVAPTEKVLTSESPQLAVTPNPFRSAFNITVESPGNVKAHVTIFNALGSVVQQKQSVVLHKGENVINIDGSKFGKGVYMVEVLINNQKLMKKAMKL